MSLLNEFKTFAIRGNVIDMAVGIIMGAAFGKIVSSLVNDIIMPPIGAIVGGVNFNELAFILRDATETATAVTVNYGQFLQTIVDFLIISAAIFVAVKIINKLQKQKQEEVAAEPPLPAPEIVLLTDIRNLLADNLKKDI
jgi:large conductance mechanosensitive channel